MRGSGRLFDFQSDTPALILSGRLMDTDMPPTPKRLRARLSGASWQQTPLFNRSAASSKLPRLAFEHRKTPLRQQHCYFVVVVHFTLQTGKGPSCPPLPEHVAATHKCQPQQEERSCSRKSTMFRKVCAVGGFPNIIRVIRLKTHVYSGEFNKATRLHRKKDTRKQELSPDDFIPQGSTANQGQRLLGRGSSGDFLENFKGNL